MVSIPYRYQNAPIPGGGFVTGLLFHPSIPGLCYARTDIGGVYRLRPDGRGWQSLCGPITHPGRWESYPLSIAVTPLVPDALFVAAGDGVRHNRLCISLDRGETFQHRELPTAVHGNASGRGTGERLAVSPTDADTLYFASQTGGLFVTHDLGVTWRHLPVQADGMCEETNLCFVALHPCDERTLLIGASGEANHSEGNVRGPSLYVSTDGGMAFAPLRPAPEPILHPACTHPGYVAQRCVFGGGYAYVSFAAPGNCWRGFDSYACDTGSCFDGALMRYSLGAGGVRDATDITPRGAYIDPECPARRIGGGLAGLCAPSGQPGLVLASTVCHPQGESIYLSTDWGEHFRPILHGLETGDIRFNVPYMQPKYNGGHSIVHWIGDLAADPFDPDRLLCTTGTGVFATQTLQRALRGKPVVWEPLCEGLEETVHLNVYAPPAGPVRLLDIVGDLGGFAFRRLDAPCENSFADSHGNRYITCMNADYPDATASPVVVTARGNWTGSTTGGLIRSDDHCQRWERLPDPIGLRPFADALLADIRRPNVNAGWTAISADGNTILWGLAQGDTLPAQALFCIASRGARWQPCAVLDMDGFPVHEGTAFIKVFADRVTPAWFYGVGEAGQLYHSADGGLTFRQRKAPLGFPACDMAGIDSAQRHEIRAQSGAPGVLWMALEAHGLWRIRWEPETGLFGGDRVSRAGDTVYRVGLGKSASGSASPALYISATLGGTYGFYRSVDGGASFDRINTARQMYGDIRSIAGDPRTFGRVYIATGTCGVLWGEPEATDGL